MSVSLASPQISIKITTNAKNSTFPLHLKFGDDISGFPEKLLKHLKHENIVGIVDMVSLHLGLGLIFEFTDIS